MCHGLCLHLVADEVVSISAVAVWSGDQVLVDGWLRGRGRADRVSDGLFRSGTLPHSARTPAPSSHRGSSTPMRCGPGGEAAQPHIVLLKSLHAHSRTGAGAATNNHIFGEEDSHRVGARGGVLQRAGDDGGELNVKNSREVCVGAARWRLTSTVGIPKSSPVVHSSASASGT